MIYAAGIAESTRQARPEFSLVTTMAFMSGFHPSFHTDFSFNFVCATYETRRMGFLEINCLDAN